ncbi:MAG: hypothetical protein A2033_10010 [Bacteroidetes bacterium GWA2_31_9]|nr:MAG: hypothetical protein A2033_10010 [Bacteroidetes bacterium GWA2_31_9]
MMLKELVKKISFFKDSEYFQSGLLRSIKTETKLLEERTIVNNFLSLLIDSKFDYDFILSILFSELYMNICQHSESEQSFYYFSKCNSENSIEIIFFDTGVGIPNKIRAYYKNKTFESDSECIEFALQNDVTTKSFIQNYGRGLDNVKSCISSYCGEFQIFSGNGKFSFDGTKYIKRSLSKKINGTMVFIKINLNNLTIKQDNDYSNELTF